VVPVNRTEADLFSSEYENNWKYLPLIRCLTALAALLHDWGKASKLFQGRLDGSLKVKCDPIRHEWISSLLFSAFVKSSGGGDEWIQKFIDGDIDELLLKEKASEQEKKPLTGLPDSASLLIWLIVSHHRLPLPKKDQMPNRIKQISNDSIQALLKRITQEWGYQNRHDDKKFISLCFEFPNGLLSGSEAWTKSLRYWATVLQQHVHLLEEAMSNGVWRVVLHHSRLCLMLGDHCYSSQDEDKQWQSDIELFANTDRKDGQNRLKQKLDEHLVKVAETAVSSANLLPYFESEPMSAVGVEGLKPVPNTPKMFRWQDRAVSAIGKWRKETEDKVQGFFVINMASTGCGKTLANAKVMKSLSKDGDSLRFVLALGLRTLTLQTGDEYRKRIKLDDGELAVLIGSKAVAELHTGQKVLKDEQESQFEQSGSESQDSLLDKNDELSWQGVLPEEELTTVLTNPKDRKMLYAPVLACTIDHIMAATETKRGGRYILPSLRLMSSDLVIDEIDDFSGDDLIAIGRLVHLAGMLGRKVMLSSATIPPDLALGFYNSYLEGWKLFAASRELNSSIGCAWVDEFKTQIYTIASNEQSHEHYATEHQNFITERVKKLIKEPSKRKADIVICDKDQNEENLKQSYFSIIQQAIIDKHHVHSAEDLQTNINVSFGVVRMANIQPCVELTRYLLKTEWPDDVNVRCMAYHSQQVLLLRHQQESHLDAVLKRKESEGKPPAAFSNPVIRKHLDECRSKHLVFILVATPVEEVGRDHDFDWAVVEPSSYRSIIQLAGRVRRHRAGEVSSPNMALMQYNWKGFQGKEERVFAKPGYEVGSAFQLNSHDLRDLVDEDDLLQSVNAIPRIQKPTALQHDKRLADLEHFSTANSLTQFEKRRCHTLQGWLTDYWWMTALPQHFCSFRKSIPSVNLHLLITEYGLEFQQYDPKSKEMVPMEKMLGIQHVSLTEVEMKRLWLKRDYEEAIAEYVTEERSEKYVSRLYGELSFTDWSGNDEYEYNDQIGLVRV
jgi:CRISPR-associated endonuclease/helicase Cas3